MTSHDSQVLDWADDFISVNSAFFVPYKIKKSFERMEYSPQVISPLESDTVLEG